MSAADRGYVALLRRPGALPLFLWVNLARLVYGALPLALLLLVAGRRGSYADAGMTLAVFSIPGFLGPARARLVDRLGARRVLVALALGLFLAVTGLDLLAGGPLVVVLGLALLAGCTPPPVGPLMRAAWRELSGGDPDVLRRAYSLDSVGEDVLFVLGPLVAAAAASTSGASTLVPGLAAVLVVAALGIGSCRPGRMPPSAPAHAAPALLRDPRFLVGLSPVAGLGLLLGGVEIASVAAALAVAGTSLAGVPAAAVSTGSVVGGLLYGSRGLPGSPRAQARWLVCVASGLVALTALGSSVFALLVGGLALAGLCIAPALVCSYLVADAAAPVGSTEATAWVNAAFNVSVGLGTAVAGGLVDATSPEGGMLVVAAAAVGMVLLPRLVRRPAAV